MSHSFDNISISSGSDIGSSASHSQPISTGSSPVSTPSPKIKLRPFFSAGTPEDRAAIMRGPPPATPLRPFFSAGGPEDMAAITRGPPSISPPSSTGSSPYSSPGSSPSSSPKVHRSPFFFAGGPEDRAANMQRPPPAQRLKRKLPHGVSSVHASQQGLDQIPEQDSMLYRGGDGDNAETGCAKKTKALLQTKKCRAMLLVIAMIIIGISAYIIHKYA